MFDWIGGSSRVITREQKEGVFAKATFRHNITPGVLLTFLAQSSLGKPDMSCT